MKSNFRHEARQALERARVELGTGDDARLKCVALELRMAMEALTYDRAQAFAAELPPTEYDTWQPKKLLQLLLEIDPLADKDSMLSFGVEEEYGVPTPVMQPLGSEKVLNLATLKRHYDALGNHLHMPTIKQIAAGKGPDAIKLRKRCEEIVDFVTAVLASPVFNTTLGSFAEMPCGACGATIRKRIPHGATSVQACCFECPASYTVEAGEGDAVVWKPEQQQVFCAKPGCGTAIFAWRHELEPGNAWTCSECSSRNVICLGVSLVPLLLCTQEAGHEGEESTGTTPA
jgi:hypothetical protein